MKKKGSAVSIYWQSVALVAAVAVGLLFMFILRLGSLSRHRLSIGESMLHTNDLHLHSILHNPINAPYKILDFLFLQFEPHNTGFARLSSVLLAFTACGLFYVIVYRWHGLRTAILMTILFGSSSWILHIGRLADGNSTLLIIPLALILFASWLNTTELHGPALLYMAAASVLALFTPGAIWFLLVTYALVWRAIARHLANAKVWEKTVSVSVIVLFAALLGIVLFKTPVLYKAWLDLPSMWPRPIEILKQWLDTGAFLIIRGPGSPALWLPHMPILDLFTTVLFLTGGYFYIRHYRNLRTHALAAFLILGSVLVAIDGAMAMSYVVPLVYLIAATGLTYLLRRWLSVFPRNPLARSVGIGLVILLVTIASFYHVMSYFVAWRYNPNTVAVFRERP